ncbi:hypothetical protein PbJCM13498_01840 [Prolixibacter bellariivorans]|uniref:DUF481 domain-containing protein n=1 Tax=Prolixibacter bellariivorans TaxID=314319 RepID=A0A5M4AUW0_9BACT|nr:hypothetical protein [Prolixibacter bellariivorans]GET31321.1 hypothetical protein PbJCM13498_01840 [Prolixibacter bellariivorans]
MMSKITLLGILLLFFQLNNKSYGQAPIEKKHSLNFFLDCHDCDFSFVRQKLKFVSFVRDPKEADVQILVSDSKTGSGGKKYYLNFIGLNSLKGQDFEYGYTSNQLDSDDDIRRGLLKRLETGILQYYSKTGYFDELDINLGMRDGKRVVDKYNDPWKKWVFQVDAGSYLKMEASKNEYSLNTEVQSEKVTEAWKTKFKGEYNIDHESYLDNGEKIVNNQNSTDFSANYIKSLNPRWSAGIFGEYLSDTYINTKNSERLYAGLEYNIFPWDMSNRKVFILRYTTGVQNYVYYEETIYNKIREIRAYQAIKLELQLVQPWGTIESSLEGSNYFHDFSKNKLTFNSKFSVRLAKQFSVYGKMKAQVVHDQLYLSKGDASLEDVLLQRRKLATTYEVKMEIGLRFTFGSIYNSVINERF